MSHYGHVSHYAEIFEIGKITSLSHKNVDHGLKME
jgi:hypothetical protein